jgi:hypothetical protein
MFRNLLGLTAVVVGLAICGPAQAGKPSRHHHQSRHSNIHSNRQAQHWNNLVIYKGRHHKHWSQTRYDRVYKTTFYFDPGHRSWFYWSGRRGAFLPISYIDNELPTNDLGPNPDDDDDDD